MFHDWRPSWRIVKAVSILSENGHISYSTDPSSRRYEGGYGITRVRIMLETPLLLFLLENSKEVCDY